MIMMVMDNKALLIKCIEQSNNLAINPRGIETSVYFSHPTIRENCFLKGHFVSRMCRVKGNPALFFMRYLSRDIISLQKAIFSCDWMIVANISP
jgi:hypothetical protein